MSYFAKVISSVVTQVIVADQAFIDSSVLGDPSTWIETSYDTIRGQNKLGGAPLRGNYAGIGFKYDDALDAFIPPKTYSSWHFNQSIYDWEPPAPRTDNQTRWDEGTRTWVKESNVSSVITASVISI